MDRERLKIWKREWSAWSSQLRQVHECSEDLVGFEYTVSSSKCSLAAGLSLMLSKMSLCNILLRIT